MTQRRKTIKLKNFIQEAICKKAVVAGVCIVLSGGLLLPGMAVQAADVNFGYVEQDIANWKAVYLPVIESKASSTAKNLPERQSKSLSASDAIADLYDLLTDQNKNMYASAYKTKKALLLYDVLNGNYTQKGVAVFLDHGFFTEYYSDLRKAGLLAEDYRLPVTSYSASVQDEAVQVKGSLGAMVTRSLIQTDSEYLLTEQLLTVALGSNDKNAVQELQKKLEGYAGDYVYKYKASKAGRESAKETTVVKEASTKDLAAKDGREIK